jgi:xanthine/uracil permease
MFFAIFIAICHFVALEFYLYWTNKWVDIPMHIMGGALVSSIGLWVIYFSPWKNIFLNNSKNILILSVFIGFGVGFLWEIFELSFGLTSLSVDKIDTIKDLFDDIIGALITGWYFVNTTQEKNGRN